MTKNSFQSRMITNATHILTRALSDELFNTVCYVYNLPSLYVYGCEIPHLI